MMSGEVKNLIWDIIKHTDEVDETGKIKPRTSYKKDHIRGIQQIIEAIKNQINVELEKKDGDVVSSQVISLEEYSKGTYQDAKVIRELHSDVDIVLNDKMKAALKFYYNDREDLPIFATSAVLDELEKLIA